MKQTEQKTKAVDWLDAQSKTYRTRPYIIRPKEVAHAIGGAYTVIGVIADEIVAELQLRGIKIRYVRHPKNKYFELLA